MKIQNISSQPTKKIETIAKNLVEDLKIKIPVHLLFQDVWTQYDQDTGDIIPNTAREDIAHDGTAQNDGIIQVVINPALVVFPMWWDINPALKKFYLRRVTCFMNIDEMILYYLAHEFHHLWEFEHPKYIKTMCKIAHCDEETLADFYAVRVLSKYRTQI
jgi:hypothetical protein